MKDSFLHALDIGALALWSGVTALAAVALWVPSSVPETTVSKAGITTELGQDFLIGDSRSDSPGQTTPPTAEENSSLPAAAPLPDPPAMLPRTKLPPIPDIPHLPRPSGRSGANNSVAARLAAGRTPGPSYPPAARATGQTGTVVMEFTVDASGTVVAASVYTSSEIHLLDQEAIRTVRTWKFPPGDVMTLIRPIVFELR